MPQSNLKGSVWYSYPDKVGGGLSGAEILEIGNIKIGADTGGFKFDYQFSGNELRLADISVPNGPSFTLVKK